MLDSLGIRHYVPITLSLSLSFLEKRLGIRKKYHSNEMLLSKIPTEIAKCQGPLRIKNYIKTLEITN